MTDEIVSTLPNELNTFQFSHGPFQTNVYAKDDGTCEAMRFYWGLAEGGLKVYENVPFGEVCEREMRKIDILAKKDRRSNKPIYITLKDPS